MGKAERQRVKRIVSLLLAFALCIQNLMITQIQVKAAENRKIDVWDIGGIEEADDSLYENHISKTAWNSLDNVTNSGLFVTAANGLSVNFGDLTINYKGNDRLYSEVEECTKKYTSGTYAKTSYEFSDGYTSHAMYYCNGTGTTTSRYIQIDNVKQGDTISVYMGTTNNVSGNVYFKYLGEDAEQEEKGAIGPDPAKVDFVALHDGSYKLYTTASDGKNAYYRVVRTPGVKVTGTIDFGSAEFSDFKVNFINNITKQVTEAVVTGSEFSVVLGTGYTYTAVLSGVPGYGFSNGTRILATSLEQMMTGSTGNRLVVEEKELYQYSGKVTGFDSSYDTSHLDFLLKASVESNADDVDLTVDGNMNFTALLEPGVEYTLIMTGVNDYELTSRETIAVLENTKDNIVVALKPTHKASGELIGLSEETEVKGIHFTNVEDSYTYTGTVTENGYEVSLRDGSYSVRADVDGYQTKSHIVVNGGDVTKNLLFTSSQKVEETMDWVSDIYVGCPEKEMNFNTVKDAVAAAKAMNPDSEKKRIKIHIAPGTYREQILVETPYISFVNENPEQEVKLTWYYGIGYKYYSANAAGYYDEESAFDCYEKNIAAKWGVCTYVLETATAFRAENITFEASFNRYVTEEEIADGVEPSLLESIRFDRTQEGADVTSKPATERAAALCVDGDLAEFYNCSFLGSQDTLYTGSTATKSYYKDCNIEGNTDYIYGDGDVVFENCNLKFFGYTTEGAVGGYITAARPAYAQKGYLMLNCQVTGNQTAGFYVTPGHLGRPWGAEARVAFVNTVFENDQLISEEGWTSMSGNLPEKANYLEYNSVYTDGTPVDTSKRVAGVVTENPGYTAEDYFADWTPHYYVKPVEEKHTLWVIGDSTVSAFTDNYYYPRYGWGTQLGKFFNADKFEVQNLALSGRSSKSYTQDPEYQTLLSGMKDGDYLFIGFGHNDEKTETERYTNPNGDYQTAGSFANSLYENYIKPAQAKGTTPVLCTPIVRRTDDGVWTDSALHITSDSSGFKGGDYPQAIRDLGKDLNLTVVDMTAMTKALYDELSAEETINLHAWTSSRSGSVDNTHTNIWGGTVNAYFIAKTVKEANVSGLSKYVIDDMVKAMPAKADYLVSNPAYVEVEYVPVKGESVLWSNYGIWKGSVFGDIGGLAPTTENFNLATDKDGNMNIAVFNNKGKISAKSDGVAMYYYKLPASSTFTLTANAKVNSLTLNDQVSFGLMARDDMYLDQYLGSTLGDYVAAAPLKLTKTGSVWNSFARKSGVLTQGGTCVNTVSEGDTVSLKLTGTSDGYTCTFGNEQPISAGFDFKLTAIDENYVYVGMFVSRAADVTFSDIKLIVDGQEIVETPAITETPVTSDAPVESPEPTTSVVPSVEPTVSAEPSTEPSVQPTVSASPSVKPSASTVPAKPVINGNLPSGSGNTVKMYTYKYGAKMKMLKVTAKGTNLSYRWYVSKTNSYSKATPIKGATKASYTPSSKKVGSYYYFCKVTSTSGKQKVSVNSRKVKITVTRGVSSIKVNTTTKKVKAGNSVRLNYTVVPFNATNKQVIFKSSNTKYATVTSKGIVKTKKAGKGKTVTITITSKSNKKVTKKVKVKIQ